MSTIKHRKLLKLAAGWLLLLGFLVPLPATATAQTVSAVPTLDLNRFMGTWYEQARYPDKAEKKCASDSIVLFALADKSNRFQVVTSCVLKDGNTNVRNANGKTISKKVDGRLKVTYTWPFSAKYWVLALGPEYEWALVGSPNHKVLWILSRTPTLEPAMLTQIKAQAAAEGFDPARLLTVLQHH